jgi:hypothetical protein
MWLLGLINKRAVQTVVDVARDWNTVYSFHISSERMLSHYHQKSMRSRKLTDFRGSLWCFEGNVST